MIKVLPCYTSKIDGGESLDLRRACSRRMRLILSKDKLETEFFSLLKKELAKTEDFYQAEIRCLILRYNRLQYTLKILSKDEDSQTDFRLALSACVQLYKESVELQTYAVTQYCGFGKILKKHDKNTE